ncbi:MAG: ABC-2 family transporter protein [Oscillospiraceae bacterium]
MAGYALLVNGVYGIVLSNNNAGAVSRIIGRGQLDHALVQPVPLPLHLMAQGFAPVSGLGPFLCGLVATAAAAGGLPGVGGPLWWLALAGLVLLSFCILTAWVYAVSALAFWAPYAAEEIATEVTDLYSSLAPYPLGGLAAPLRFVLCTLLPVGGMAFLPAAVLLGKTGGAAAGLLAAVAAGSMALCIIIVKKGFAYYAKYSSPRYSGFGRS